MRSSYYRGFVAAQIARMGALRGTAEQAAYLANIKERHGWKRNFMKLLE
ncbi:hypothetical protein [Phyllobacterium phragmitis]|nr:hypothetical protein [Phyllobacterium phragmitis]